MKISLRSYVSVFLIVVLTLSAPISFSQQNSDIIEAKITAERDARNDVGKAKWLGGGFLLTGGTILILRILGEGADDDSPTLGLVISGSSCLLHGGGLAATFMSESTPPPSRLVGKSAEYVNFYTDAYRTESRRSKALWGVIGSASGCLVVGGILLIEAATKID